jgi:hypothetical protein
MTRPGQRRGDAARINQCIERLTDEPFEQLEKYMRNGRLPQNDNEIILLDGNMQYLETIDKKAAMAAAKAPAGREEEDGMGEQNGAETEDEA